MSDAITKFISKLTKEEKKIVFGIIERILKNELTGLNAKKLVGSADIFRIRKGKFRVIYKKTKTDCLIISVERRSEKTYRDF